ncbi:MAG: hypothetical protein QOI10_1518 [Solirubrobacterales bacterium]|jgi:glycosyltransferase involved in cell wall biosynthesis|nr:hypothetical protein [Solirubrobacterales bacterium]
MVSDYGAAYRGSFVPMIVALAERCAARGWAVECAFTPVSRDRVWLTDFADAGIPVGFAPRTGRVELTRWLAGRLRTLSGPKIIHTHFASFDLAAVAAALGDRDARVIWHLHSALPGGPIGVAKSALKYGIVGRRVAKVISVSEAGRELAIRRGLPASRIVAIENGIDAGRFPVATPERRREAREALGVPAGQPVVLHLAWDWEIKGGPLFLASLTRLLELGVPALALIVSADPRALAAVERAGLSEHVRLVAPVEDVRRFYDGADVLASTSPSEGGPPLAVVESLACGTAVLGTDIPSHRMAAGDPPARRLVAPEPAAIAEGIASVLARDSATAAAEAAASHDWVRRYWSLDAWTERVAGVYSEVLAAP